MMIRVDFSQMCGSLQRSTSRVAFSQMGSDSTLPSQHDMHALQAEHHIAVCGRQQPSAAGQRPQAGGTGKIPRASPERLES